MSALSNFIEAQESYNDRLESALEGISSDITELNDLIKKLQDSAGTISAEDQASLDRIQAKGDELADKAEALDELHPPVLPEA